jgi:hypothetical protein
MRRFKKIFSISFLIVTVIVTIVTINTMSTPASLMGIVEQLSIRNIQLIGGVDGAKDSIKVTIINTGSVSTTITNGSVYTGISEFINHGSNCPLIDMNPASVTMKKSSFAVITLMLKPDTLVNGTQYNVKLQTAKCNTMVYHSIYDSASSAQYDPLKDEALQSQLQQIASTPEQVYPHQNVFVAVASAAVTTELSACLLIYAKYRPLSKENLLTLLFFTFVIVIVTIIVTVFSYMDTVTITL